MRKKSTRLLSAALAVCMMLSVLPVGAFAAAPGAEEQENGASAQADAVDSEFVEINSTNFPDQVFREFVKQYDNNNDGKLSQDELAAVTEMDLDPYDVPYDKPYRGEKISSLKGIEHFTSLKNLNCKLNLLTELDVSKNPALESLDCSYNQLRALDVSNNLALKELNCCGSNNGSYKLSALDVSNCPALEKLNCKGNELSTLDVSHNLALTELKCGGNSLGALDVSKNSELNSLDCEGNHLSALDVSKNSELNSLNCGDNKLSALNVSNNSKLTILGCWDNKLSELDLRNNSALEQLTCYSNQLSELDVSQNKALKLLNCGYNLLSELNVSQNLVLEALYCDSNQLSELDVSQNKALEGLICRRNQLSALDLSNNQKLSAHLYCDSNQLTSLNLGERYFEFFSCNGNSYDIVVDETNCYDLSKLPGKFDASKVMDLHGGTLDKENNILTVDKNATEITYTYNCGTYINSGNIIKAKCKLNVTHHTHHYGDWLHDEAYHWHECTDHDCPEPEESVKDKAEHTFDDNAKDKDCNTCGYVRPLYTVTTGENVTAKLEDEVLNDPVAADTKVHLTATVPEGQHFIGWTVKVGDEEQKADTFLTPDKNDPTKATFTMPSKNVEVTANFASNPTLNPTLRVGDHVTATIEGSDASVPSGSTVPVPKNKIVHLTATVPDGQHFISWTVLVGGEEQKADTFLTTPDENDLTKVTFTMPSKNVEVTANFAENPIPEPDPVGPSDTGNIQGAISAVVVGAAAGAIIYEAGTGIYRVINMPGIPMPSNRIELAELLWEHAGKPEPVSTALYSDIDEGDTDAQKAARWAVEQDLMKDDADNNKFHPAFPVSKLRTCLTWNAAKEKGLFDKTEE